MALPFILIVSWGLKIVKLLPFPAWSDSTETREWLLEALKLGGEAADETATTLDDKFVDGALYIVENDELYKESYDFIAWLVWKQEAGDIEKIDTFVSEMSAKSGIDIDILRQLLDAILKFIEWFQNR